MMIYLLISFVSLFGISNLHDYHSTLLSMQYNTTTKSFEMELTIETDHFEYALNKHFVTDIHLGETKELENCDGLITTYLNQTIQLHINKKPIELQVSNKWVDYGITTIEFVPIYHKKKVRRIEMKNKMMFEQFPRQQNLVQIFYKKEKAGWLFGGEVVEESISF